MLRARVTPLVLLLVVDCAAPRPESPPLPGSPQGPAPLPASTRALPTSPPDVAPPSGPHARGDGKADLAVVHRIKQEAFRHGQVDGHLFWLTDANGPRLTASPGFRTAADWAVKALSAWGVSGPHVESWGRFGRAWTVQRFELALVEPGYARLSGVPKAWSRGTAGTITGGVVAAPLFPDREDRDDALDLPKLAARFQLYAQTWRGKLRGRFVLLDPARDLSLPKDGEAARLEEKKLGEMALSQEHTPPQPWSWPVQRFPRDPKKRAAFSVNLPLEVSIDFADRRRHVYDALWRFLVEEGALGVLATDDRGDGALVFAESTGAWEASRPLPPPVVAMPPEDYDRLVRLSERSVTTRVRLDAAIRISDHDEEAFNVVAELPGSGPAGKRDELVILGAHLDSWHGGTGATDNGAGCAVMLEAVRILKTLALPLNRTVRLVLWSGEEQGLYGSRAYVKQHFGDPVTMALGPDHAKVSVYLNLDNGTGRIRGVYLQENDMARPLFDAWLAPFKDEGVSTITVRNTGGTDHLSFDAVGIPGFQFIQDPLDYGSRTHHSSLDVYEHAQPGDLMQAAAIVASVAYAAANQADMVPRKPLPAPLPPKVASP